MRVAIVGLGPSAQTYMRTVEAIGDIKVMFDEVWTINGFSNVFQCTRGFAMDDVRVQISRAEGGNKKVANMLEAFKRHPGPVYTSVPHPDYPALVEYPLEAVINSTGQDYFNSTIAYAIALAIHERAETIAIYGADYTFPDRHIAERGRACCEFWLGIAHARGIKIGVPGDTSLMDACEDEGRMYGYDFVDVVREVTDDGWCKLTLQEKDSPPTAEEIEKRYYKGDGALKGQEAA